jgi:hypothetical protein
MSTWVRAAEKVLLVGLDALEAVLRDPREPPEVKLSIVQLLAKGVTTHRAVVPTTDDVDSGDRGDRAREGSDAKSPRPKRPRKPARKRRAKAAPTAGVDPAG